MKIIKPFNIDDTSLVSSTIPEPDASLGEVEFVQGFEATTKGIAVPVLYMANDDVPGLIFTSGGNSPIVSRMDDDFNYISADFDASPTVANILAVCYDPVKNGGTAYFNDPSNTIYEFTYNTATKAYTGNSFSLGVFSPLWGMSVVNGDIYCLGYISGSGDRIVRVFSDAGTLIDEWPPLGIGASSIFSDGEFIYIVDTSIKVIKKYSSSGAYVSEVADINSAMSFPTAATQTNSGFSISSYSYSGLSVLYSRLDSNFDYDGQYKQGDEVILSSEHKRYQCVIATFDNPAIGVGKTPPSWVEVSPTNKWAMFSNSTSTTSKDGGLLVVEVSSVAVANGVAGFDITGAAEVNVIATKSGIGELYNKTITLRSPPPESGWYSYLFDEVKQESSFVLTDLPAYRGSVVKFTFTGVDVCVGALISGHTTEVGIVNYNSTLQLIDYSKKERDEFGNVNVIKRTSSKLVKFNLTIPTSEVGTAFAKIQDITTIPAVYIGLEGDTDSTRVFGYYEDYHNNITTPTVTTATLTVQGLA